MNGQRGGKTPDVLETVERVSKTLHSAYANWPEICLFGQSLDDGVGLVFHGWGSVLP
jgi:hypothetical protein